MLKRIVLLVPISSLLIKSVVVITDELIYTFDQGELCRHPVTVPGADPIIYHT